MEILYAATSYPPAIGGAQIHLHCLAKEMQALGHRVRVATRTTRNRNDWLGLSTYRSDPAREFEHEGIDVSQIGFSRWGRLRTLPWALSYYALMGPAVRGMAELLRPHLERLPCNPSLVHASRIGREFLPQAALDYARSREVPFVLTPNHHPRWRGPLYRQYDRIYRAADAVIALTDAEKDLLISTKGVREDRVHVTGIGPVLASGHSADEFRAQFKLPNRFVLFLGQQLKYKGLGALVEAAPLVWRAHPDVQLVLIGPPTDYSRKLFAQVQDKRIRNLGSVDLNTKTSALAACQFLCVPSVQESFGGVFVEAWSMRKAVIGGRIPPVAKVIDEQHNGLLSSQDPQELAEAINSLLSDEQGCTAMGQAGWEKVQRQYTWARISQQTMDVYRSLAVAERATSAGDREAEMIGGGGAEGCVSTSGGGA